MNRNNNILSPPLPPTKEEEFIPGKFNYIENNNEKKC